MTTLKICFSAFCIIVTFIIVRIIFASYDRSRDRVLRNTSIRKFDHRPIPYINNNTPDIVDAIHKVDPAFNTEKFNEWAKQVFITMQKAWSDKDESEVRGFEGDTLFSQHARDIRDYVRKNHTRVVEHILVHQMYFHEYERNEERERLKMFMSVKMKHYVVNDKTRKVLSGSDDSFQNIQYMLIFMRRTGVATKVVKKQLSTITCPNCGAPLRHSANGQCEYCHSVITTGEYGWILENISEITASSRYGLGGIYISEIPDFF